MLNLSGVHTAYDRVPMLRDVTMTIAEGDLVCLLGSNGAGKTTTVKTIMGLIKPTRGEILFEGDSLVHLNTNNIVKRGIAIVPEGRRLFPKMTVWENLRLGAFYVKNTAEIDRRMVKIFDLFPQLRDRVYQLAGTLSGGEQSMATIGRGLMGNPRILLLDEPSLGLAPKLVQEYFSTIKQINTTRNLTILLIEQNATKALSIADYGYVLQKGRILADGRAQDLLKNDVIKNAYLRH